MSEALLNEEALKKWTGYTRKGDLEKFCKKHGIRVFPGRNGTICTTLTAVNQALAVSEKSGSDFDVIEFES